jgi:adenosylcobinamide kinase/adenosylcobinamide-phosphate guanylyltransferase
VLGGARSGKSRFAEEVVEQFEGQAVYIATAEAKDREMTARIEKHRTDRNTSDIHWKTVEEPKHLAKVLEQWAKPNHCLMVDCLTLWVTNCLFSEPENIWQEEKAALLEVLPRLPCDVVLVSNEVGLGIVPLGEVTRTFVDEAGWLNQSIASLADKVTFVAAGCPLNLK